MGVLDFFALFVILLLVALAIWLVVVFGSLPGDIARRRNHPQAEAITALGWIGIVTLGMGWFIAMVWAYYIPGQRALIDSDLEARVVQLEQQIQQLQSGEGNT